MPIQGMEMQDFWANGGGDSFVFTVTFEFPPMYTVGQVTLTTADVFDTPGYAQSWIVGYRHRLDSGADETIVFPDFTSAPNWIIVPACTSITYAVNAAGHAHASALANAFFF